MTTAALFAASSKAHKLWGGRFGAGPAPEFEALNSSIGVDFRLWPYDIQASKAWAVALGSASKKASRRGPAMRMFTLSSTAFCTTRSAM
jgi:hypothetical protein